MVNYKIKLKDELKMIKFTKEYKTKELLNKNKYEKLR